MPDQHDTTINNELQSVSLYILGEPASKANSRRLVRYNNVSRLIKSQKALNYGDMFKQQCKPLATLMTGDLVVTITIFYATRRPDLDESLILDLMQGLIYENDRQVKEKHIYWGLDKLNPRAEIIVEKKEPRLSEVQNPTKGKATDKL
jgi:Holliday junction resolvase RusA-like endonuclease